MNLNQTIEPSPSVISQEVAGETVLLDLDSEHYFGLDAVGTRVWQLIEARGELRTIVDTLLQEYDVDEQQLLRDLEDLVQQVSENGLVVLKGESTA